MVGAVGVGLGRAAGTGIERGLGLGGRREGLPRRGGGPSCSQRFFNTLRPPDFTAGLELTKGCRGEKRTLVVKEEPPEHTRKKKTGLKGFVKTYYILLGVCWSYNEHVVKKLSNIKC